MKGVLGYRDTRWKEFRSELLLSQHFTFPFYQHRMLTACHSRIQCDQSQDASSNCGRRLLPVVIDDLAQHVPDRPWASIPFDDCDLSLGFEDVTYAVLENAVNKVAGLIVSTLGRSSTFGTIAYFGVPDIRYHIVTMAVTKTLRGQGAFLLAAMDAQSLLPNVAGRPHLEFGSPGLGTRFLLVTPPYHCLSVFCAIGIRVFGGGIFLPGYRNEGVYTADITDLLTHARASKVILTPWNMEDVARRPNAKEYIEPLDLAIFAGATLSLFAANAWAKHTHIQNGFGATETLLPARLMADNEDHAYCFFDRVNGGIDLRPLDDTTGFTDEDARPIPVYEMVLTLNETSARYSGWHASNGITPESSKPPYPENAAGGLWAPHPDPAKAEYAWRFVARKDDIVTLSAGVDLLPAPMEGSVARHPGIRVAQLVGKGRQQPLLLVELAEGCGIEKTGKGAAERLWVEVVRPLNAQTPVHGRVARSHVLLLPAGSFPRTPKGSTVRKKVEAKHARAMDAVYDRFGDAWQDAF